VAGLATIVASMVTLLAGESTLIVGLIVIIALGVATSLFAQAAVGRYVHQIDLTERHPRFQPKRPVLICNPKSGGGKVEQFDLVSKAEALGVEVVLLEPGLDLEQLARDAVTRGADCLGMAGGDGSQALVSSVAIEHRLPFVCISAGTRNHFALDLGLDRDDPSAGLAAFRGGRLRHIDYGRVGGRLFVNNVSFGVYAKIVNQDEYRDAKLATTTQSLPELLGSQAEPFDLQFTAPDGSEVDGSFVILVSNNQYRLGLKPDVGQRDSLTDGILGVFAINARSGAEAAELATRAALGRMAADPRVFQFATDSFQVRSQSGRADAGVDGESLELSTPIDFTIHPLGMTVLVPSNNPAVTTAKHYRALGVSGLWDIARGRKPAQVTT
jgi:diacylglycerol kinase family enzyme